MPVLPLSRLISRANRILKLKNIPNTGIRRRVENVLDDVLTHKKYKMKPSPNTVTRFNNVISRAENNPHLWPKGKMPKNPLEQRYRGQKD